MCLPVFYVAAFSLACRNLVLNEPLSSRASKASLSRKLHACGLPPSKASFQQEPPNTGGAPLSLASPWLARPCRVLPQTANRF